MEINWEINWTHVLAVLAIGLIALGFVWAGTTLVDAVSAFDAAARAAGPVAGGM